MEETKKPAEELKAEESTAEAAEAKAAKADEDDDEIHPLTKMFLQGNYTGTWDNGAAETGNAYGWNLNDFR